MPSKPATVRADGTPLQAFNSGLEVWLYDEANRGAIRTPRGTEDLGAGGMPPDFEAKTAEGLVVGYSLMQDDEISVFVYVGEPFSKQELSVGRWLEPQVAFLKLPSGTLCVEPNDGSRIGPEEPTDKGGVVKVPPGDYRLTLYRVDHEALDREELTWDGAQELILLTPGGKPSEAASYLLPFEQRRDTSWVGKYNIKGKSADALIWFPDGWDTFILNLDAPAVEKLGVTTGNYLQTTFPETGLTIITTYGTSWDDARRMPQPDGVALDEFGYAALLNFQDWDGAQGMFCRRDKSKTRVEEKYQTSWRRCTVEVLAVKPREVKTTARGFVESDLSEKSYFDMDVGFLSLILSDVLPGVGDLEELPLPEALERFDKDFGKLKLKSVGDVSWEEATEDRQMEFTARMYTGRDSCFAAIIAHKANIHIAYLTEKSDGQWILTGLLDDFERAIREVESRRPKGPKTTVESMDEELASILEAHEEALEGVKVKKAPSTRDDAEGALRRFLTTAFG